MRTAGTTRTRGALLAPALLAMALLAACGAQDDEGTSTVEPGAGGGGVTSTPDATAAAGTDLTIVVDNGSGTRTTWKLTCDPAGGDHPDPAAACAALEQNGERALPPVPADQMCTQIFGGPDTATITGTWKGAQVSSSLSKANGCEVSRWKQLAGLLPDAAS